MSNRWSNTGLMVAAVVVALLLGALVFYSGVLAPGYILSDSVNYEHEIEAGPGDNVASEIEFEHPDDLEHITYRYEELSPIAQELFDRTRTAESATYTPKLCTDHVLVCDTYYHKNLPSEFTYGKSLDNASLYTVIVYDGDEYLLRTGVDWTATEWNPLYGIVWMLFRGLLLFHAGALVTTTLMRLDPADSTNTQLYAILIGGGTLAAGVGFLTPYIEIAGLLSGRVDAFELATIVTLGYAAAALIWLIAAVTQR